MPKLPLRFDSLDLLRGLAALLVLAGHARSYVFQSFFDLQQSGAPVSTLIRVFYFATGLGNQAVIIFFALSVTTLLWAQWNPLIELTLLSVVVLTGLGFYDDYAKIQQQSGGGARSRVKLLVQIILALFVGVYLWMVPSTRKLVTDIMVPPVDLASDEMKKLKDTLQRGLTDEQVAEYVGKLESDIGTSINQSAFAQVTGANQ